MTFFQKGLRIVAATAAPFVPLTIKADEIHATQRQVEAAHVVRVARTEQQHGTPQFTRPPVAKVGQAQTPDSRRTQEEKARRAVLEGVDKAIEKLAERDKNRRPEAAREDPLEPSESHVLRVGNSRAELDEFRTSPARAREQNRDGHNDLRSPPTRGHGVER